MPIGPGKYNDLCTYVRVRSGAAGAIVIVIDGDQEQGFSVQATPEVIAALPRILRHLADQIEHGK